MSDTRNRWDSPAAEAATQENGASEELGVDLTPSGGVVSNAALAPSPDDAATADAVPSVNPEEDEVRETQVVREEESPKLEEGQLRIAYRGPRNGVETLHGWFNKNQAVVVSEQMFDQLRELTNPDGSKLFEEV